MTGKRVSYDIDREEIVVEGLGPLAHNGYSFIAPAEIVGPASVTSLRNAMARHLKNYEADQEELLVSSTPADHFDEDYAVVEKTQLLISTDETLLKTITHFGTELDEREVERLARSFLQRMRCEVREFEVEGGGFDAVWSVTFAAQTRGRTVNDLMQLGRNLEDLLFALGPSGKLTAEGVRDLARAGSMQVLLGQTERSWLEVKSQAYRLDVDAQKIELAQDVARFANAEEGGLLLLGLKTKKIGEADIIRTQTPIPLDQIRPARYRKVIDARVFPPIVGLEIELCAVAGQDGHLLIVVPPQPEELKPFLVHGAVVAGRVEGAFISIVRRRGQDSIPISAASIHSMLAAGRALLRGKMGDSQ